MTSNQKHSREILGAKRVLVLQVIAFFQKNKQLEKQNAMEDGCEIKKPQRGRPKKKDNCNGLRLLSLFLSCSLSRCSSEQFRLLSLALCRSLSRWAWFACRLLSRFLCLSLSLYSKLEDIINKISRIAELRGAQPIRKIYFSFELTSLKFSIVYASRNAGGPLFSRKNLCTHRLPEILHWFGCGADGRSVGRSVTW